MSTLALGAQSPPAPWVWGAGQHSLVFPGSEGAPCSLLKPRGSWACRASDRPPLRF